MRDVIKAYEIADVPMVFIREGFVNIDDLINAKPGQIVRCSDNPANCVKVVGGEPHFDHIAGMISEDV